MMLLLALLLITTCSQSAEVAFADGDPASDALLFENVFYPYSPSVSRKLVETLNGETAAARRGGFPIKVALIASTGDLGAIPIMFGKPATYAGFLDEEIRSAPHKLLLVVMPGGYGVSTLSRPARAAGTRLAKPASGRSDDLARAAIAAVPKLAAAAGHPLGRIRPQPAVKHDSGWKPPTAAILALAAIIIAGAIIVIRQRRARRGGTE